MQQPGGGEGGDDGDLVPSSLVPAPTVIKFCRLKRDVVKYIQHGYRFIIVILSFTAGLGDLLALNHTVSKDQFFYVFYGWFTNNIEM